MEPLTPNPDAPIASPAVYTVWKQCWNCHRKWQGKCLFPQPQVTEDKPLPGMCSACIQRDEDILKQSQTVTESGTPIENIPMRPRVGGVDD